MPSSGSVVALLAVVAAALAAYLRQVSRNLTGPHDSTEVLSDEEVEARKQAWKSINMLDFIPNVATGEGYAVIGGSGMVGSAIVELLLLRKEKNIRIIDLTPPRNPELSHPSVTFVKADITSPTSLRNALLAPFPSTGKPPSVIYLTAVVMRFWERARYCKDATWPVNVTGTRNVLDAVGELPGQPIFVYTSTAELSVEAPNCWTRLSGPDHEQRVYSDETVAKSYEQRRWYTQSKFAAEQLILDADRKSTGARHGIVRPGYHIIGYRDLAVHLALQMTTVPSTAGEWAHSCIAAWDAAAALLLMEDALRDRPSEVRGKTFLVTGKDEPWCYDKLRRTAKKVAQKPANLVTLPPLTIVLISHAVEAFLYVRYHALWLLFSLGLTSKPSVAPKWIGQVVYLQPSTFNNTVEFKLDDSRARKVLGYRPQWGNAEATFDIVERMGKE